MKLAMSKTSNDGMTAYNCSNPKMLMQCDATHTHFAQCESQLWAIRDGLIRRLFVLPCFKSASQIGQIHFDRNILCPCNVVGVLQPQEI